MAVDMKLVRKGRGEPRAALAEQARVLAGLAKQHVTELDKAGWKPAKQAALEAGIT
ncbi:MAG: hypothetical protein IT373_34815, partial [Polyangiaceae bacterium]|nr:hypothetical protein [Polyangiaceae bacterium]MCC6527870.1 hypothetical protein [Polyangiaceae bacterium]